MSAEQVGELDTAIERHRTAIERLIPVVCDPEDVPDQHGRLPRDRRHSTFYQYRDRRIAEVREIRALLPELEAQIKATDDRAERSKLRAERDIKKSRLDKLLAVPRLEAKDMCADCATSAHKHGYVSPPFDYPCPAWPGQRAIHKKMMQMLETFRQRDAGRSDAPSAPKPEPLAIVPSGLPIAEVVERLQHFRPSSPRPRFVAVVRIAGSCGRDERKAGVPTLTSNLNIRQNSHSFLVSVLPTADSPRSGMARTRRRPWRASSPPKTHSLRRPLVHRAREQTPLQKFSTRRGSITRRDTVTSPTRANPAC